MTVEQVAPAVGLAAYAAGEIRAHLGRHTISKSELARRLGEDEAWVRKRLNGRTDISLTDLERMAAALAVSATLFLPRSGGGGGTTHEKPHSPIDPLAARLVATVGDVTDRRGFRPKIHRRLPAEAAGLHNRPATRTPR